MGVDLALLPIVCGSDDACFSVLDLVRRGELWDDIWKLKPRKICKKILIPINDNCRWGYRAEDSYGELTYLEAHELLTLSSRPEVKDSAENRAAFAYLAALPPDTKIILYWC